MTDGFTGDGFAGFADEEIPPEYIAMLIVEDGTNVENANTLFSAAMVAAHALLIGNTVWVAMQPLAQEQAIYRAMRWFRGFERNMKGARSYPSQLLPFPRIGVCVNGYSYNYNEIPSELIDGLIEAALLEASIPDALQTSREMNVKSVKKKLGRLSKDIEYFEGGTGTGQTSYPKIESMISMFLEYGQIFLTEH